MQARSQPLKDRSASPTRQCASCGSFIADAANTVPPASASNNGVVSRNIIAVQPAQAPSGALQSAHPTVVVSRAVGGAGLLGMCYNSSDRHQSNLHMDDEELSAHLDHCSAVRDAVAAMSVSFREMESHTKHLHSNGVHATRAIEDPMEEEPVRVSTEDLGAQPARTSGKSRKTRGVGGDRSHSADKSGCTNSWCCAKPHEKGRRSKKGSKDTDSVSL